MATVPDCTPAELTDLTDLPLPDVPDLRLVVSDMDGTLLDEHGELPPGTWPLLERLHDAGVAFAPASGRQHATLVRSFAGGPAHIVEEMTVIAENGSFVTRAGDEVASTTLDPDAVRGMLTTLRDLAAHHDLGVVVCGKHRAYVERDDAAFRSKVDHYYASVAVVPDLLAVLDEVAVVKLAVHDFADAETGVAPALAPFRETHQVVVSGEHWIDVMAQGANKGVALAQVQADLGVTPAQTVVFGDYLNDVEMLGRAEHSFAMANAHPDVLARARWQAPSHAEHGVLVVLEGLLSRLGPRSGRPAG